MARLPTIGGDSGTWGTILNEWLAKGGLAFNVKDGYGAVGDGVADDQEAIVDAIDACVAAGGGNVFFPPGTYRYTNLTSQITATGVTLIGAGRGVTTLRPITNNTRFLYLIGTNITLRSLSIGPATIAGTGTGNANVEFITSPRVTVEDCEFFNTSSIAVAFNDCSTVRCVGNWVHDSLKDGIHFVNCDQGLVIRDNHVKTTGDDGIAVWCYTDAESDEMYGCSIIGNVVEAASPGKGIQVAGSVGVQIVGNTTKSTVSPGIRVGKEAAFSTKGCRRVTIMGNNVFDADTTEAGGYAAIEVSDWNSSGVRVYNAGTNEDITVVGNTVHQPGNQGIEVSSTDRATVVGNTIVDSNDNNGALTTSLEIRKARHVTCSANVIVETRGSPQVTYPIVLTDITNGECQSNVYDGMTNEKIFVSGTNTHLAINGAQQETVASGTTITPHDRTSVAVISGTTTIDNITAGYNGQVRILFFQGSVTVRHNAPGNIRLHGSANLAATATDSIALWCDGVNWIQLAPAAVI